MQRVVAPIIAVIFTQLPLMADTQAVRQPDARVAPGNDVFGVIKVWQFHIELIAKDFDRMQPKGSGRFPGPPAPKRPGDTPSEAPTDVHKGSGFGLEFPWVHAELSADGMTYKDIGLRYKGNASYGTTSRGLKRNFCIDLDHYDDQQRFHGLKSIMLNAGGLDPSRGRETLSFAVFRAAGVVAPRTAFAEVTISIPGKYDKEFVGLYTFVEHVDKTFLKDRFKSNRGLLMKPEGMRDIQYLGEDWKPYEARYRPKHEPSAKEKRRVIEFAKLVDKGSDEDFQKQIVSYLDVDQFLRFVAANAFLSTIDNFFTAGHNYFLYLDPQTNKFVFIPWDMDVSLAAVPFVGTAEQRMDLSLMHPHPGQHRLIDRLLAMKDVNELYQKLLRELAGTAFSRKRLLAQVEAIESVTTERLVREKKVTEARKEAASGPGFGFAQGIGMFGQGPSLRTFVEKRTTSVTAQLAGERKGWIPEGKFGAPGKGPEGLAARYIIFRDKVQDELKIGRDQKKKLHEKLETMNVQSQKFFQSAQDLKPEDRPRKMHEFQMKANEQLGAFLRDTLKDDQLQRLHEIELQHEGPFAVMQPEVARELKIKDEQRQQFVAVIQEMQKKVEPLMREIQSGGDPSKIVPKIHELRQQHATRLESLLNETQQAEWKKMIGKQFSLDD